MDRNQGRLNCCEAGEWATRNGQRLFVPGVSPEGHSCSDLSGIKLAHNRVTTQCAIRARIK
jgi:hypothetical protein